MRGPIVASILLHAGLLGAFALAVGPEMRLEARWRPSRAMQPARMSFDEPGAVPDEAREPPPPSPQQECDPHTAVLVDPAVATPFAAPALERLPDPLRAWREALPVLIAPLRAPRTEPVQRERLEHEPCAAAPPAPVEAAFVDARADEEHNAPPAYPAESRRRGDEGTVRVELHVDEGGAVTHARVVASSGHRSLDRAALQALRKWRFHPARRGGVAVATRVEKTVVFRLVAANG